MVLLSTKLFNIYSNIRLHTQACNCYSSLLLELRLNCVMQDLQTFVSEKSAKNQNFFLQPVCIGTLAPEVCSAYKSICRNYYLSTSKRIKVIWGGLLCSFKAKCRPRGLKVLRHSSRKISPWFYFKEQENTAIVSVDLHLSSCYIADGSNDRVVCNISVPPFKHFWRQG